MKKETIFKHEINESIQAKAALNCLKNRNTPKKLNESADFDARFEFRKDLRELASPVAKKAYMIIRKQYGDSMWRRLYMDDCDERGLIDMLNMYAEKGLNPQQIVNKMLGVREDEEEEYDMTPSYQAYYSQDEPDYENDHHGIWLIINLMRSQGLLRAQGIEGRDDVDDGHAIDKAYDLIEQKLDEEGMWIGDDDNEAARFVSFFGEEIAAEAMKSAIHNQEQEESFDDAEDFISNVVNLMEDEGMIDETQWDDAYYTVEEMIQSNPNLLQYPSYMQFLNVFADDILSKL